LVRRSTRLGRIAERRFHRLRQTLLIGGALGACAFTAALVIGRYGGGSFFPGLIASFIATLFAFLLALWWERKREQRQLTKEAADLDKRRVTEVRRRFAPIRAELEKDAKSLEDLARAFAKEDTATQLLHPQLLEGAWIANAPRLSELVADYELIGDLAGMYGRIEELRWRLRHRFETVHIDALDRMTSPLVGELQTEVADLLERVGKQIDHPSVQALGLAHNVRLTAGVRATARASGVVVPGVAPARSITAEGSSEDE
jgi:hypothetical protein